MTARRTIARATALTLALAAAFASPLGAQRTHLLIVTGLGGEPHFSEAFAKQGAALHTLASAQWRVADSSLIWLAEDPAKDTKRIRARATRESIGAAFLSLAERVAAGDVVVVVLIGHGSGEGPGSRVNVSGVDPTAADYASWIAGFTRQTVVFVNAASASGDFVDVLRAPGRVVVTATKTAFERNESVFGEIFVRGLSSAESDADKDGRTTVLEAFTFAVREVARSYEKDQRMLTEHALLSDSTLAARTVFAAPATSGDPRVVALVAERRVLEDSVAALRAQKAGMPPAEYEERLENLLVAIAEKTEAIRAAGVKP